MNKFKTILFLFIFCSLYSPLTASLEKVMITSTPTNASLFIDSACVGKTPLVIELDNTQEYTITAIKEGHVPTPTQIENSISKAPLYMFVPGGVILLGIDMLRGKAHEFTRSNVHIRLPRSPIRYHRRKKTVWKEIFSPLSNTSLFSQKAKGSHIPLLN